MDPIRCPLTFRRAHNSTRAKLGNVAGLSFSSFPVARILYLTPDHTIDPPSLRLLAIHRAIGRILHLSGAEDSIDRILRDMDEVGIKENGSTELGQYISLKLGGWWMGSQFVDHTEMASMASVSRFISIQEEHQFRVLGFTS